MRVREVLAQSRAPGDAVLTASGVKGTVTLNADGSFAPTSTISLDLGALRSDSNRRDGYVKDNSLPLSGDIAFTLAGKIIVHGMAKDVTFAVRAAREGTKLTATATADRHGSSATSA